MTYISKVYWVNQNGDKGYFKKISQNIEELLTKTEQLLTTLHGEETAKSLKVTPTKNGITYKGYLYDNYGNRTKYKLALARITEVKE